MAFMLGSLVNFFYYDLLSRFPVSSYGLSLFCLLIGNGINAAAVALILTLNLVTFPVGGLVLAVSQVSHHAYGKCRQALDVLCILLVLILVFGFHGQLHAERRNGVQHACLWSAGGSLYVSVSY